MIKFEVKYEYAIDPINGIVLKVNDDLNKFNSELLNIGDLKTPSKAIDVLAVIFDLEGFTNFTKQVDPKLAIPTFISDFFDWLYFKIKVELSVKNVPSTLWAELPFFSKFLGDGVLFLWKIDVDRISGIDTHASTTELTSLTQQLICNIVGTLHDICRSYDTFLIERQYSYVNPPSRLRCGIARGDVFSLGNFKDFIGPCINIASRLQKFHGLSFGVSARGIDNNFFHEDYSRDFLKKKVSIRGIGDNELIYVLKREFNSLSIENKTLFT